MAQQTFSGVPGDFSAGQVLTAADMDKLREFLLYLIKDGDETDTGEVSPLILDLANDRIGINEATPVYPIHVSTNDNRPIGIVSSVAGSYLDMRDTDTSGEGYVSIGAVGNELRLVAGGYLRATVEADGDVFIAGALALSGETAAGNQLDDYEEGTWSPTYVSSNGDMTGVTVNATYTEGQYQKVGRWVTCTFFLGTTAISDVGTGYAWVSGFPFDKSNRRAYTRASSSAAGVLHNFVTRGPEWIWLYDNGSTAYLSYFPGTAAGYVTLGVSNLSTAASRNGFFATVTYETDD